MSDSRAERRRQEAENLKALAKGEIVTEKNFMENMDKFITPYKKQVDDLSKQIFSADWGFRVLTEALIQKKIISHKDIGKAEKIMKKKFSDELERQRKLEEQIRKGGSKSKWRRFLNFLRWKK